MKKIKPATIITTVSKLRIFITGLLYCRRRQDLQFAFNKEVLCNDSWKFRDALNNCISDMHYKRSAILVDKGK